MGSRKRPKPNPKAEPLQQSRPESSEPTNREAEALKTQDPVASTDKLGDSEIDSGAEIKATPPPSNRSWYGGSWPRGSKATPVTQVARESIAAATGIASDLVATARTNVPRNSPASLRSSSLSLSHRKGSSTRSLPLAATTTKLNITSNASDFPTESAPDNPMVNNPDGAHAEQRRRTDIDKTHSVEKADTKNDGQKSPEFQEQPSNPSESKNKLISEEKPPDSSSRWLGWFSSPASQITQGPATGQGKVPNGQTSKVNTDDLSSRKSTVPQATAAPNGQERDSDANGLIAGTQTNLQPRSWLGLWSNAALPAEKSTMSEVTGNPSQLSHNNTKAQSATSSVLQDTKSMPLTSQAPAHESEAPKSTGWAFWSRESSKDDRSGSKESFGKLALAGSPSQSHPENAVIEESQVITSNMGKSETQRSVEKAEDTRPFKSEDDAGQKSETPSAKSNPKSIDQARMIAKKTPQNLILPSLTRTYRAVEKPSVFQQLSRFLRSSRLPDTKHVSIVQDPPQIRRALAIGVHGYFPAPLLRSVLGQPTGTSIRFANGAASAIQRWTKSQGYCCEIEKVALEGEGKIAERIDLLWKLMLNWIDNIRKADLVMIACHSQGVPVTMMLVAKLIAFGCVHHSRIGVCALAGVNLGPFADYKSRWISGSAGELFEFAHAESQVSKDYRAALDTAVRFGVRIVYIGSIDDQLVSLESSTFGTVSHPYIFRAVFVDGRVHAPDFLTHLVGFALKLRNLGISDHGLIRELSSPLAGSLYTGEGHSRIYDDDSVY
ncbi:hypothetical protein MMC07_001153 [Pseudocyphellaria aurata]|nr:hypothetical protein [Pseudocyphellaria aurata]